MIFEKNVQMRSEVSFLIKELLKYSQKIEWHIFPNNMKPFDE